MLQPQDGGQSVSQLSELPQNRLLRLLATEDLSILASALEPVRLARGAVLIYPNEVISNVVFPDSGVVSVVATTEDGHRAEIGLFGREGMSNVSLLLGVNRTSCEAFVQIAGSGWQIKADDLLRIAEERPGIRVVFMRYIYAVMSQGNSTAVVNATYTLEERLARWLLMCHDRVDGDELRLTHEFLGIMLAVRRSGVTTAMQTLEGKNILRAKRGLITVVDRAALLRVAGTSYGAAEAEHERVLGPFRD